MAMVSGTFYGRRIQFLLLLMLLGVLHWAAGSERQWVKLQHKNLRVSTDRVSLCNCFVPTVMTGLLKSHITKT
jgi:hypothetical protein